MLRGFKRFKWSLGSEILRTGGEIGPQPSSPPHPEREVMGWCEADFKTDFNCFYTKDEWMNSGAVIQRHPAQRPKLLSVLMECCLVMAKVYQYQAPFRLPRPPAPARPDSYWL